MFDSGDTAFVLVCAALVVMMTLPALGLFYRSFFAIARGQVMLSITALAACVTVLWSTLGYRFVFGGTTSWPNTVTAAPGVSELPEAAFAAFQLAFAVITPALLVGVLAHRVQPKVMLSFLSAWSLLVYCPVAWMVWGDGGWLKDLGVLDFAGGLVVHLTAGVAAVMISASAIPPSRSKINLSDWDGMAVGGSLLTVGWLAFNGGSALAADGRAAMAVLVSLGAAAAGVCAWAGYEAMRGRFELTPGNVFGGAIAGLVAITPASGFVTLPAAIFIGILAGVCCAAVSELVRTMDRHTDPCDVIAVHGFGGMLGTLATGLFATKAIAGGEDALGAIDGSINLVFVQIFAVVVVVAFTALVTGIMLRITRSVLG